VSQLDLHQVNEWPLIATSMHLGTGLHVVLGAEHDGTRTLLELVSGLRRPKRGSVKIDGRSPFHSSELRRRIASVFRDEVSFEEATVLEGLRQRLAHRGQALAPERVLERYQLARLAQRHPQSLTASERQALTLVLALCTEQPLLLAIEEPLAVSGIVSKAQVLRELRAHSRSATVLCVTSSPKQAAELGNEVALLDSGHLKRVVIGPTGPGLTPGSQASLVVVCAQVNELAQALCLVEGVTLTAIDPARAELRARAQDLRRLAHEILRVVVDRKLELRAMTQELPELGEVRAANAALSRVAYERAYAAAAPPMPAAHPPPAGNQEGRR
jgi:ABC-type thiamine transport system ATPase subunit